MILLPLCTGFSGFSRSPHTRTHTTIRSMDVIRERARSQPPSHMRQTTLGTVELLVSISFQRSYIIVVCARWAASAAFNHFPVAHRVPST